MQGEATVLASNSSIVGATAAATWKGGRGALVLNATAYGTTCSLQFQGPSGAWINLNGTAFSADQVLVLDLPPGQYRMNLAGTTTALYATLARVQYG